MSKEETWLLTEKYNGIKSEGFFTDCKRLSKGEPLAYIIGHVPFLDTKIYLDSHPLIPRPETEFWTEVFIHHIRKLNKTIEKPKTIHILDLCTGSGAIGVAIKKALPYAHVTFGELEMRHVSTIEKNVAINNCVQETAVVQSDLFENIKGIFDFIVTNPPYIDKEAKTVDTDVVYFEPHEALFGGKKGLALIEKIIAQAPTHLTHAGELWLEHEPFQSDALKSCAERAGLKCTVHTDQYGTERFSRLCMAQ